MDISTLISEYKSGRTLKDLAIERGCTSEWVRQILLSQGLTGKDGGQSVRTAARRLERSRLRDEMWREKRGCTFEQYRSVISLGDGGESVMIFYSRQRNHANSRGVEWLLSFWEWWNIWRDSGRWDQRGKGVGKYCMCRFGDSGSYEKCNVYIDTVVRNSVLGRTLAHERGVKNTLMYRFVRACGGRKVVAEIAAVSPLYVSVLSGQNSIPAAWFRDGRIERLVGISGKEFSATQLLACVNDTYLLSRVAA